MTIQTRRKVSYVIRQPNGKKAHCLGVNSLAIDKTTVYNNNSHGTAEAGVLYSAGRDGVVAGWQVHIPLKQQQRQSHLNNNNSTTQTTWMHDRQVKADSSATCHAFSQMHTDWVNDIVVCDQGNSVVSASADRTIKLWRPYSDESHYQAQTIGWHTDYVKCLAYASEARWVASAGLDKRIHIWDFEKSQARLTIQVGFMNINHDHPGNPSDTSHNTSLSKSSIYAMAVNPSGTLLVTGSPEKVVRMWDPRSGKRVSKLTGHTDNIRALLISDDGQHVLSGSSDSTIKLWSIKAQRCMTTYETHADSIWSLYSDHADLKTFYAGSRDGLVTKTEIPREGASNKYDEESECIGLFKENSGVGKIVAFDDTYIWTATSTSSINRWLSVPSRESRQVLASSDYNPDIIPPSAIVKLPPTEAVFSPQSTEHYIPNDGLTLYAGSVMSIPMSYNNDDDDSTESVVPLREYPDQIIEGNPGITAHLVLQNRLHILTKDTTGEVALWDLVRCMEIQKFGQRPMEQVAQEINGIESFPSWCSVTTKIGAITVQLLESNCFDCEMYADQISLSVDHQYHEDQRVNLGKWLLVNLFSPFVTSELLRRQTEHDNSSDAEPKQGKKLQVTTTCRMNTTEPTTPVATSTMPSIRPERMSTPISLPPQLQIPALKIPLTAITTHTDSSPFYHPSMDNHTTTTSSSLLNGPMTAPPTTDRSFDYFSGPHYSPLDHHSSVQLPAPAAVSSSFPASPVNSNFMHRLKNLSVKTFNGKGSLGDDTKSEGYTAEEEGQQATSVNDDVNGKTDPTISRGGDDSTTPPPSIKGFPPLTIPPSTPIIIAEESAEASTGMDLYRGDVSCVGDDHALILKVAPSWLLSFLLYNKTPSKETVKLTFILKPHPQTRLPGLPGGPNNRLLANRILRIRKLLHYIVEKIDPPIPHNKVNDDLEILCNDTVLTPTMTLASVKQHILKSSGDVILSYRYKAEAEVAATTTAACG